MNIKEWYEKTTGGDTVNAVATRAKINQPTLHRQVQNWRLSAETVVHIARGYSKSALEGLMVLGLIKQADIDAHFKHLQLSDYTDAEIVDEIARRLDTMPDEGTIYDEPPHRLGPDDVIRLDAAAMDEAYDPRHDEDQPSPDDE
ncbi:hypothetical protein QP786_00230 [Gleimia europaea]|nr:hypothetical protein [Gleimia europaea]MDK8534660.1 hypothetical protein [Gleimia europaea]